MFSFYQPLKQRKFQIIKISTSTALNTFQRLLWHVLTIIVFWINSFFVLDFLSNPIADSVKHLKCPSSWFIFICFGCYFIFHSILAREHSRYHFCSFWSTWDCVCGLACDVWDHMGSCHGQLEIVHSTRDLLILSLRYFFSGAGTASEANIRAEEHPWV